MVSVDDVRAILLKGREGGAEGEGSGREGWGRGGEGREGERK